jgi:Protein of unknown function (DUF998)
MTTDTHISTSRPRAAAQETVRYLALGAIAGPILFTVAWLVLGFLSPGFTVFGTKIAPYSPVSAGISGLGLGVTAPFMNAAFMLNGLLLAVGVVGTFHSIPEMSAAARWGCTALLALVPLGSIIDGVFTLESFFPHFVGFALAMGTPILTFPITGVLLRRIPRWRWFANRLLLGGPLTLALLVLYFATFSPTAAGAETGVAGLTERILITEVLAWFVALGWLAFRRKS